MATECITTKMAQFMMGNGLKIKNQEKEKCYFLMVRSMTVNGTGIRCMVLVFLFHVLAIDLREISKMA